MAKPLTAAAAAKFQPGETRRIIRDGGARSLFLVVQPSGHKSWQMRFRRPGGTPAKLTLGTLDLSGRELNAAPVIGQPLSVSAARQLAAAVLRERALGADVFADHAAARRRRKAKNAETFGDAAQQFVEEHARIHTRRWQETARTLGLQYPRDGGKASATRGGLATRWAEKPLTAIDSHDIYDIIDECRRHGVPGLARTNKNMSDSRGRKMARTLSKMFGWLWNIAGSLPIHVSVFTCHRHQRPAIGS